MERSARAVVGALVLAGIGPGCCGDAKPVVEPAPVREQAQDPRVEELEREVATLRAAYAQAREELREQTELLSMEDQVVHPFLPPGPPVPAIDAAVVATKDDVEPPLVLLSVGSDDRVEQGFRFSVYRGSQFVGKVVVEKVLSDSAGCRVLFTADGLRIQAGDQAATRLQ